MTATLLNTNTIHELADDMGDMAQDIILDLVDSLENDINRSLPEMRAALASGSAENLRRAAHRLKSSCANLGAAAAAALCQELENLGGSGAITDVGPMIDELDELCVQSVAALRAFSF
jgi:HPt (histidine-containing phosphotransfer) domain-containing protein